MSSLKKLLLPYGVFCLCIFSFDTWAKSEIKEFELTIENHVFSPKEITIPANQKVKIIISNKDSLAEEFDSFDLNRERVIFANKKATIYVGPLPPGRYEYFGEYHPNSARGFVIVKDAKE